MAAKVIQLSPDDSTYYTVPGSQGDLTVNGAQSDDTIFGQTFKSSLPSLVDWSMNANAVFKGYQGYLGKLQKSGVATTMTDEACTLVSGKTYQITATTKRVIDRKSAFTVKDNAVDKTDQVLSVDPLFGNVTFKSTYTVTGPVTVTGKYLPLATVGRFRGYTLGMTADSVDETDYDAAQANSGYKIVSPGLRQASLEIPMIHVDFTNNFQVADHTEYVVSIDVTGDGKHMARGFFLASARRNQGNVGALEETNISFTLQVPVAMYDEVTPIAAPLAWQHVSSGAVMPMAVRTALDAWAAETTLYAYYAPKGLSAEKASGEGQVTNISLASTVEGLNTFQVAIMGVGELAMA